VAAAVLVAAALGLLERLRSRPALEGTSAPRYGRRLRSDDLDDLSDESLASRALGKIASLLPPGKSGYHIFLSYRRKRASEARVLAAHFERAGLKVFIDLDGLAGGHFATNLEAALRGTPAVVALVSPGSLAQTQAPHDWVRFELANALKWKKFVMPIATHDLDFDELGRLSGPVERLRHMNFTRVHFDAPLPVFQGCLCALGQALSTELRRAGPDIVTSCCWTDEPAEVVREAPASIPTDVRGSSIVRQRTFETMDQLADMCEQTFKAVFLLLGYGDKGLYEDFDAVKRDLSAVSSELNDEYGAGEWAIMFGGDTVDPTRADVATVAKWLQTAHGAQLIAVQCSSAIEAAGIDEHVNIVLKYPTHRDERGKILWGGWSAKSGLRGASREYFSDAMLERRLLRGVIVAGGGMISRQDCVYAMHVGLPIHSVRASPRFLEAVWRGSKPDDCFGRQGPVDHLLDTIDGKGALHRCGMWLKLNDDVMSILEDRDVASPEWV